MSAPAEISGGLWARASALAAQTPESRNRYVDFLRAASITVVVFGHWLMAAPTVGGDGFSLNDMLRDAPWTQGLTWIFQVMPLFFIVGGYANAVSWDAAARRPGFDLAGWYGGRLRRLISPVVPLVLVWALFGLAGHLLGIDAELVGLGSKVAFTPTWFLAVYVMVIIFAPGTYWLWRRFGVASFWGLAIGAICVDALAFGTDTPGLRWANYAFVWLSVHQLGYLWRDGRLAGPRALWWAAGGLLFLVFLVKVAGYPVSMLTVPGDEMSNSRPPSIALLALGIFHAGLALSAEGPARRWLTRATPWTATVLVNANIMTLYLWHATAMVLLVGLAYQLGGIGLHYVPASGAWWASRPVWMVVLLLGLAFFMALFGRFERSTPKGPLTAPIWQYVLGAAAACTGLANLVLGGIAAEGFPGVRIGAVILALAGAVLLRGHAIVPLRRGAASA